jgi:hypothetical protein
MRYALIGMLLAGCGNDKEVVREHYRVHPDLIPDAAPSPVACDTCEATVSRLLEQRRIKVRKGYSSQGLCEGL